MELVALLEAISIVGVSVCWLNSRLSRHIDVVMGRYIKKVEIEHKVITDRIDTLEQIIVEYRDVCKCSHSSNQ